MAQPAQVRRVYYARPIQMVGTAKDLRNIEKLKEEFPGARIDYATESQCRPKRGPKNMQRFFERVDKSDLVVIAEAAPQYVSSGVYAESQHARHAKIPVKVLRGGSVRSVSSFQIADQSVRSQKKKWAIVKVRGKRGDLSPAPRIEVSPTALRRVPVKKPKKIRGVLSGKPAEYTFQLG